MGLINFMAHQPRKNGFEKIASVINCSHQMLDGTVRMDGDF